jgi:multidrug efflux pump subunit AcrA (membrane-fusion protein)
LLSIVIIGYQKRNNINIAFAQKDKIIAQIQGQFNEVTTEKQDLQTKYNQDTTNLQDTIKQKDQQILDLTKKLDDTTNTANQKQKALDDSKAELEATKADLKKVKAAKEAAIKIRQAQIAEQQKQTQEKQTNTNLNQLPVASSISARAIYYVAEGQIGSGQSVKSCSGQLIGTTIRTVNHCNGGKDITHDPAVNVPLGNKEILIDTPLSVTPQKGLYYIMSADKGVVSAKEEFDSIGLYPGAILSLILTQPLGEGNSGSAIYDWTGKYVGALSVGLGTEFKCPIIPVPNYVSLGDQERFCSYKIGAEYWPQ